MHLSERLAKMGCWQKQGSFGLQCHVKTSVIFHHFPPPFLRLALSRYRAKAVGGFTDGVRWIWYFGDWLAKVLRDWGKKGDGWQISSKMVQFMFRSLFYKLHSHHFHKDLFCAWEAMQATIYIYLYIYVFTLQVDNWMSNDWNVSQPIKDILLYAVIWLCNENWPKIIVYSCGCSYSDPGIHVYTSLRFFHYL